MKTLKKQIEVLFNEPFDGHPTREDENEIRKCKEAILTIAQAVDNIIHYTR